MSKLVLLIGMMFGLADLAGAQQPYRVAITDFGAVAGSGKDAVPAIRRALAACKEKGRAILVFPKGRYDLYPDSAIKKEYFLSNTSSEAECPSKWKTIGMMLEGMKDLTVEGEGSLLIFHGKMITFAMDNCDHIVLRDLEVDFKRPTMSELTIENVTSDVIDVRVHPDSWYKLDSGRLTWYGEGWVAHHAHCIRIDTSTQAMYYANEEYEQLMKAQVMETGRSQLSFHGAFDTSRFRRGNIFTVRDPIRDEVGALILSSRNVRLQNMGMHYMHGLGILSQYSENIFMDSVMVEPRKGSGRRIASFADGMHFSGCKGTIRIAHCRFNGLHDDAINVHGTHLQIVEKRSGNQWVLRFMHPQTYGFQAFREKDSIAFVHPATLGMFAEGRVQHVLRLSDREILLTFDKAAPSSVAVGDVVENTTWTPRVIVRNCLITGSNTRGILVTTRRKVIIEGNEFRRLGMQAILIADDALSWYESGPVKDVLIRNNTFTNCGHLIRPAYAIVIAPENHQLTDTPVHRNIRIENNRFSGSSDAVMAARSVEGLTFINNTVRYMEPDDPAARYLLVACRKGTIRNNHYRQAQQKAPVPIILDTDIGPDYDDVGAVAILHALADKGECRPLAIMASNKHPLVGPAIDILNIYFGRPNLPIGAPKGADAPDKGAKQKWPEMLVKKYPHHINATAELPDAVALYRKILAAAPDTSVTIVTVGFLTNLAHLLESKADGYSSLPGAALIRKKVKRLVSMAGRFPEGREYNVLIDSAASEKVFLHWPTPVIYSGFEIGREIITGRELIANEKLQSPVKDVFALSMAFSPEDHDGRMSWDETAVLVAIRGVDPYFGQHRGRIILKGGSNEWIDDPQGDQAYLTMKMPAEELRAIIELMMMTASSK